MRLLKTPMYVYVIDGGDRCKVGMSIKPKSRVADVCRMAGLPRTTRYWASDAVPNGHGMKVERMAHQTLAEFRLNGEWFNCSFDKSVVAVKSAILRASTVPPAGPKPLNSAEDEARVDRFVDFLLGHESEPTALMPSSASFVTSGDERVVASSMVSVIPRAHFDYRKLSEENKRVIVDAVLQAVGDYGNGGDPECLMESLCDIHRQHIYHAWAIRHTATTAELA